MKHALINKDNKVDNIIVWDGRELTPPKGMTIVRCDDCNIGDTYDPKTNKFNKSIDVKPE